jgi:hypothetical protein
VSITRIGKLLQMAVTREGDQGTPVTENVEGVAVGRRQVLNLHQNISKFYIGGVPDSAAVSLQYKTRFGSVEYITDA